METINVTIDEEGNPVVSVEGCTGKKCADLTASLERALGKTTADTKTAEFYQSENKQNVKY